MAKDNKTLGKLQLTGIPAARRGVPQIEVTFDIDANGIVNVSAKDLGTGRQQQITISGSTALNDEEVDRMVKDAEAHAEEDKKHKEEVETRNNCDALVNATEQTLNELGDKVPADPSPPPRRPSTRRRRPGRPDIEATQGRSPRSCSRQVAAGLRSHTASRAPIRRPARQRALSPMTAPSRPTTRSSTTKKGSKSHDDAEHARA